MTVPGRLAALSVEEFVSELGEATATPGGGSAAALAASLAAALLSMAAGLSAVKKGLEAHAENMQAIAAKAKKLAAEMNSGIDADAAAFDAVLAAVRLPKGSDDEKAARRQAMNVATMRAALVPFDTLSACLEVARLLETVRRDGNPACSSDVAAATFLARAGGEAAWQNVAINLDSLSAPDIAATELRERAQETLNELRRLAPV